MCAAELLLPMTFVAVCYWGSVYIVEGLFFVGYSHYISSYDDNIQML